METRSVIDTLFSLVKILALSKMLSPCLYCIHQMHENNEVFLQMHPKRNCKFLTDHQAFSLIVDSMKILAIMSMTTVSNCLFTESF